MRRGLPTPPARPSVARARERSVVAESHLEGDVLLGQPLGGQSRHGLAPEPVDHLEVRRAFLPQLPLQCPRAQFQSPGELGERGEVAPPSRRRSAPRDSEAPLPAVRARPRPVRGSG
jgi:hypothetical protein